MQKTFNGSATCLYDEQNKPILLMEETGEADPMFISVVWVDGLGDFFWINELEVLTLNVVEITSSKAASNYYKTFGAWYKRNEESMIEKISKNRVILWFHSTIRETTTVSEKQYQEFQIKKLLQDN